MVNQDLQAIVSKLNSKYNCDIWIDKIKQGFTEPCFFIRLIKSSEKKIMDNRFIRKNNYMISYFNDDYNEDLYEKINELHDLLDFISLENGDLIRGIDANSEVIDGIIHFNISYNYTVIKEKEKEPLMGELNYTGGLKNG